MKKNLNYSVFQNFRREHEGYHAEKIKDSLIIIAARLAKIEDKNPDYLSDKKWIYLRNKQDALYEELRREKCLLSQQSKTSIHTKSSEFSKTEKDKNLLQR